MTDWPGLDGATGSSASEQWRSLVEARIAAVEAVAPGSARLGPAFWDARAHHWATRMTDFEQHEPFVARLREVVGPRTTLVDVGAGSGRFALPLAAVAREVIAVDSSRVMLDLLREEAQRRSLNNVRTVHGAWQEVVDVEGDIVVCAYVLPLVADAARFLARLDDAARQRVFIYIAAVTSDLLLDPLWRYVHGRVRPPGPSFVDAVTLLREIGIDPQVEIVQAPAFGNFASLDQAVDDYAELLRLRDEDPLRSELRELLTMWLVVRHDGLHAPTPTLPAAIISWSPRPRDR
ncbi:MAG: class I SAM-dependent methyltransferase [Actinomycetota bacterium]|nr:class I SAM-dependent methyltransferase [Actinomycetota bacterium]